MAAWVKVLKFNRLLGSSRFVHPMGLYSSVHPSGRFCRQSTLQDLNLLNPEETGEPSQMEEKMGPEFYGPFNPCQLLHALLVCKIYRNHWFV